jgi:hypothetical protein
MADSLEIVRAISQAASLGYDGALDEEGNPVKVGLKREQELDFRDSRIIDGFKVKFQGSRMAICYQCEVPLRETHNKNFESDIAQTIADVSSFLKKEYKKITGGALSLTKEGEPEISVQNTSRVRNWVEAQCWYKIGGMDEVKNTSPDLDQSFKSWLNQGKSKSKGFK